MRQAKPTNLKKLHLKRETIRTGIRAGTPQPPRLSAQADSGMGGGNSGIVQTPTIKAPLPHLPVTPTWQSAQAETP